MVEKITGIPEKWDSEADIIVVGFGASGAAAAIEAHDLGAKVIIVEKMPLPGGGMCESGGAVYGAGTPVQEALGIKDSAETMYKYMRVVGKGLEDPELTRILADKSAGTVDWFIKLGATFHEVIYTGPELMYADVVPPAPRGHMPIPGGTAPIVGGVVGGEVLFNVVHDAVMKRKIEVMLETQVFELIVDWNTKEVFGVRADNKGKMLCLRAKKAVFLGTGGYAHNNKMIRTFVPAYRDCWTIMPPGLEGDGQILCQEIGADLRNMGIRPILVPTVRIVERPAPSATALVWTAYPEMEPVTHISVNKQGKRFMDEFQYYLYTSTSILQQEGGVTFAIFDEDVRKAGIPAGMTFHDADMSKEIEAGIVKKADTFRDLAAQIGIDPAALQETLDRWNANVKSGHDPDFGRTKGLRPIMKPPFYAVEVRAGLGGPMCGVAINKNTQVLHVSGMVIPRLYAAGDLVGGSWMGETYPGSGLGIGPATTFGRIAAQNAVAEKPWG